MLRGAVGAAFNYTPVGLTREPVAPPPGFDHDVYRTGLGSGDAVFERARRAVAGWRMFRQRWVRLHPAGAPLEAGTVVAVEARVYGFTTVNPCRVVYTVDEETSFGFAYGTLQGHVERGEERFLVRRDPANGTVELEIVAVSRPAHPLARLGYPLARRVQRRFGRGALAVLRAAVEGR